MGPALERRGTPSFDFGKVGHPPLVDPNMMTDLTPLLADPDTVVAVVGATDHPWKYGSIIYRDLKARGIRVVAVNPHRSTVDGDPCYPDLSALPERPAIIDLVVPAAEGQKVVAEARRLGWGNIWLQPGSGSPALLADLEESDLDYLAGACIMVRARVAG